jgi:hypothetical protein
MGLFLSDYSPPKSSVGRMVGVGVRVGVRVLVGVLVFTLLVGVLVGVGPGVLVFEGVYDGRSVLVGPCVAVAGGVFAGGGALLQLVFRMNRVALKSDWKYPLLLKRPDSPLKSTQTSTVELG